jgi:VWFA-related protein
MSSTPIRSLLAVVLIALFVVTLLPPTHAYGEQSSAETRPRRGKNDSSSGPSKDSASADPAQQGDDGQTQSPVRAAKPGKYDDQQTSSSDDSLQRDADTSSQANSQDSQSKRRRAPAFDRPPLGSDSQSQTSQPSTRRTPQLSTHDDRTSAGTSRGTRTQQATSQRTSQADSRDGAGASPDDATAERGTQQRPVLRRPSDQVSQAGRQSEQNNPSRQPASETQRDQSQRQQGAEDEAIKLESTLVNLPLLVSDRSGRFIPQLTKKDFLLYEDGVQQEVASFGSEEVPFSVALLLDVSPSVQGNIPDIQEAALAFVRQLRNQDRVMVVAFDRRAHYLTDFTNDRRLLESAIRSISTGSGTSVYDVVYETVAHKLRGVEGRKALILFSDGEDTTSNRAGYDDAINIVTESDVLVYGLRYPGNGGNAGIGIDPWPRFPMPRTQIPFPLPFPFPWPQPRRRRGPFTSDPSGNPSSPDPGQRSSRRGRGGDFMADIAAAGGGPVFDAERVGDMTRLATRIADELRHVYVISYYPTNPLSNGGYRAIRVSVKGRDDIAVRHRRGYNARDARSSRPTI